jgi:hypothetical protein
VHGEVALKSGRVFAFAVDDETFWFGQHRVLLLGVGTLAGKFIVAVVEWQRNGLLVLAAPVDAL